MFRMVGLGCVEKCFMLSGNVCTFKSGIWRFAGGQFVEFECFTCAVLLFVLLASCLTEKVRSKDLRSLRVVGSPHVTR